jgi:tRNA pseudouridine55 synthase
MIRVHCSKGTYVRSIAEDLGAVLNVGAHVSELRRINSGPFGIDECISLDRVLELGEAQDFDQLDSLLRAVDYAIQTMPMVSLDNDSSFYLCQGQPVVAANLPSEGLVRVAKESGEFLGVAEVLEDGRITPRRLVVSQEARTT